MADDARLLALADYIQETARIAESEKRKNYTARAALLRDFAAVLRALVEVPADVSPQEAVLTAMFHKRR